MKIYDARDRRRLPLRPAADPLQSLRRVPRRRAARRRRPPDIKTHRRHPGGNDDETPPAARRASSKKHGKCVEDGTSRTRHTASSTERRSGKDEARSRSRSTRPLRLRVALCVACVLLAVALLAARAGGRGDRILQRRRPRPPRPAATPTSRRPSPSTSPGAPEAAQNVIFNAPEGVFGNPDAITHCTLVRLRPRPVPVRLPGRADHRPRQLRRQPARPARHRADLRPRAARATRRRCFAFIVPTLDIPINDPGRGADRRRLRPALHRLRTSPS